MYVCVYVCVWCACVGCFCGTEVCIYILLFEQTIDVSILYILLDSHNHAILIMQVSACLQFSFVYTNLFTQTCEKCSSECLT